MATNEPGQRMLPLHHLTNSDLKKRAEEFAHNKLPAGLPITELVLALADRISDSTGKPAVTRLPARYFRY